ncbi:centriolar and ciliogenesis-associated protein HYLS1-like isoform X2 [Ptychodera flava]
MSDEQLHFSEEDIKRQLAALGYYNVPDYRLKEFAKDLAKLVEHERSRTSSRSSFHSDSFVSASDAEPYHYTHRVPLDNAAGRGQQRQLNYSSSEHTKYGKENEDQNTDRPELYEGKAAGSEVMRKPEYSMYEAQQEQREVRSQGNSPVKSAVGNSPSKKIVRKRKVVRKIGGQSQVFDESITESEPDDVSSLEDQFRHLPVRDDGDIASVTENESTDAIQEIYSRRPHSARPDLYPHRPSGDEDSVFAPHLPRSFIRPSSSHPHTKNLRKTDPVTRYQLYRQSWNTFKVPGEKNRKELRWAVREQMLQQDEVYQPKRDHRVYVPNSYVVPTDKKRQALRWEIRTELAHGQMPPSKFS